MTILSLALTMVIVVVALGTEATYQRVVEDSSLRAKPYELLVGSDTRRRRDARADPAQPTRSRARPPSTGHRLRARQLGRRGARALGGDYARRPYAVRDGRMFAAPGEAIVGRGLLDALKLKVGDRLPLDVEGARLHLRIVGRYIEPDNDARTAIFDRRSVPAAALARFGRSSSSCSCTDRSQAHAVQAALSAPRADSSTSRRPRTACARSAPTCAPCSMAPRRCCSPSASSTC